VGTPSSFNVFEDSPSFCFFFLKRRWSTFSKGIVYKLVIFSIIMKPRHLGISIVIVSIVIIGMLFYFNSILNQQNLESCSEICGTQEGTSCSIESCPFNIEHNNSEGFIFVIGLLVAFLGGIGFYLTLTKAEKLIEQKEYDLTKLNNEEKEIFLFIKENKDKGVYQSNIVEKFNIPKSKVSRILDKLERLEIVERKRRGMTNIILLK